jgi:hypothetical protein
MTVAPAGSHFRVHLPPPVGSSGFRDRASPSPPSSEKGKSPLAPPHAPPSLAQPLFIALAPLTLCPPVPRSFPLDVTHHRRPIASQPRLAFVSAISPTSLRPQLTLLCECAGGRRLWHTARSAGTQSLGPRISGGPAAALRVWGIAARWVAHRGPTPGHQRPAFRQPASLRSVERRHCSGLSSSSASSSASSSWYFRRCLGNSCASSPSVVKDAASSSQKPSPRYHQLRCPVDSHNSSTGLITPCIAMASVITAGQRTSTEGVFCIAAILLSNTPMLL